jgi:hypothetical protein
MKKTFCDACGYEIEERAHSFDPLIHIVEFAEGRLAGYVDKHGLPTSGRAEHFDLCGGCYINVFTAAYKVIQLTRQTLAERSESK